MDRYNQTEIHPAALLLTLGMSVAILVVRRDRSIIPILLVACLVTHAQRIVLAGFDLSMLRIVILFGWVRVLLHGEIRHYRFHTIDAALGAWLIVGTLVYSLGPRGSFDAAIQRLGLMIDIAGAYFLVRILLRDVRDIFLAIGAFSWIAIAVVVPMTFEGLTGRNLFSALGGVSEYTIVRGGRLRCQASFSHPIMAGTFGATTAALLIGNWLIAGAQRMRYGAAIGAAVGITVLSSSSGPAIALLTVLVGWILWRCREIMPILRWSVLGVLLLVHFAREKPVWHLIGRLSSIIGGEGWHRYRLINEFFAHFDEWWLMGSLSTSHWNMPIATDITNQYILEGVRGGLGTLLIFVAMLILAFRSVGWCLRHGLVRKELSSLERRRTAILAWTLGVCTATHCVSFLSVSYFGQLQSLLFLELAMVPSLACALLESARSRRLAEATSITEMH